MTKAAQNLLLIAIGAAVLWITLVTGEYVNYVKPGFRLPLVASAIVLIVLGGAGLRKEWREAPEPESRGRYATVAAGGDDAGAAGGHVGQWHGAEPGGGRGGGYGHDHASGHHHGHDHGHRHGHDHAQGHDHGGRGPRVAWLMCLPVLAIFAVAPPALGSYTASRDTGRTAQPPPPPPEGFGALPRTGEPIPMTMGEFIGRSYEAQTGQSQYLRGVPVELTGFVTPHPRGPAWQVTRLKMACCAGDAVPFPVVVHGLKQPPADTWVRVVGTWRPPANGKAATGVHELQGQSVTRIKKPRNPYE